MRFLRSFFGPRRLGYRASREKLLSLLPKGKTGAEIGVWKGDFSERILAIAQPSVLHLVDPWLFSPRYPMRLYGGRVAKSQSDMDAIFGAVVNHFKEDPRVVLHRESSTDFFAKLTTRLDWVYIDGDHSRDAVFGDLRSGWNSILGGGFVCGDDLDFQDVDGTTPVSAALALFSEDIGITHTAIGNQFYFRKVD